ncbi:MAG: endonuclease/exonuclease/phosphatase family protein [Planctomycetes bacterium]|nr:endonuclease/exonuclease/phosphatase family protein [Planctomycetota bacterium]
MTVGLDAAAVTTLLAGVLQFVVGTWAWPFTFALHFFDAAAPLWAAGLIVACARRSRWRSVMNGGLLIAWCILCGPRVMRAFDALPQHRADELRIVTFNAGNGRATPEQLCAALRTFDADIVFLQELAPEHAAAIESAYDLPFPYRALFPTGIPGKGILARYPLRAVRLVPEAGESNHVRGSVMTPVGEIEFIDVHANALVAFLGPWMSFDERVADWALALPRDRPVILAGDFNLSTSSALLDPLREAGFREAFDESGAGLGLSFPLFLRYRGLPLPPLVRIDQIWTRGLECVDARLGGDVGSDHSPLRARFVRR